MGSIINRLKIIFLDPSFLGSVYPSLNLDEKNVLTWDNVIGNMSSVSIYFFGGPVVNQLGGQAGKKSLPHISKRYIFTRIFQNVKVHPEIITATTAVGGVLGYTVSEINQNRRNSAQVIEQQRANDLKEVELGLKTKAEYKSIYSKKVETETSHESADCTVSCCFEDTYSSRISRIFYFISNLFS